MCVAIIVADPVQHFSVEYINLFVNFNNPLLGTSVEMTEFNCSVNSSRYYKLTVTFDKLYKTCLLDTPSVNYVTVT